MEDNGDRFESSSIARQTADNIHLTLDKNKRVLSVLPLLHFSNERTPLVAQKETIDPAESCTLHWYTIQRDAKTRLAADRPLVAASLVAHQEQQQAYSSDTSIPPAQSAAVCSYNGFTFCPGGELDADCRLPLNVCVIRITHCVPRVVTQQ